jgi:hypothetical protein
MITIFVLVHVITTTTTSSSTATTAPCLDELNTKETCDKPGQSAEETEEFYRFPVSAETAISNCHAEELTTVDCLHDEPKGSPPSGRKSEVQSPRFLMFQGGDDRNDAGDD